MEEYLSHYGILGMKWGIRRYQNKDGSLTEVGKRHYADPTNNKGFQYKRNNTASVIKKASSFANNYKTGNDINKEIKIKKDIKNMSDEELKKKNTRQAAEQLYMKNNGIRIGNNQQNTGLFKGLMDAADIVLQKQEKIDSANAAKTAKKMSDSELRQAINRMQLEDQYRNLSKRDRDSGADYVFDQRKELISDILTYATPIIAATLPLVINKSNNR